MSKKPLLAAALLVACAPAFAQGYVTLSGGPTKLDSDCTGTTRCDNTGTGFKLLGGYKFTNEIAVEAGYLNFGKASATVVVPGAGSVDLAIKTAGFGGGIAVMAPIANDWLFAARLGLAQVKAKADGRVGNATVSLSDSNPQLYAGLAFGYRFNKNASIDLSFDSSRSEFEGEKANVTMFGVGLTFSF